MILLDEIDDAREWARGRMWIPRAILLLYLVGTLHMLPLDTTFAFLIRVAAFVIGAASLTFAVWLLNEMRKPRVRKVPKPILSPRPIVPTQHPQRPNDAVTKWDEVSKDL